MGGFGSGSGERLDARDTTADFRSINVRLWAKQRLLKRGSRFIHTWLLNNVEIGSMMVFIESDRCRMRYQHSRLGIVETSVVLDQNACHFGGARKYFRCPSCGTQRVILYCFGGGFACRQCMGLNYPSTRQSHGERAAHMVERLQMRLGGDPGVFEGVPGRPRWMRHRTYERHVARIESLTQRCLREAESRFGREALATLIR